MDACRRVDSSVLKLGAAALAAEELHFSLWLPETRAVRTLASHGASEDDEIYSLDQYPVTEQVLTTGVPAQLLASDETADRAELALLEQIGGFKALLLVPVARDGGTIGLLEVYRREEMGWTQGQVRRAMTFAAQLGSALSRPRLAESCDGAC
jgi:GAF domain-containing protein